MTKWCTYTERRNTRPVYMYVYLTGWMCWQVVPLSCPSEVFTVFIWNNHIQDNIHLFLYVCVMVQNASCTLHVKIATRPDYNSIFPTCIRKTLCTFQAPSSLHLILNSQHFTAVCRPPERTVSVAQIAPRLHVFESLPNWNWAATVAASIWS